MPRVLRVSPLISEDRMGKMMGLLANSGLFAVQIDCHGDRNDGIGKHDN